MAARIAVNLFLDILRGHFNQQGKQIQRDAERLGRDASERWAREWQRATPRVQQAMLRVSDRSAQLARRERDLNKIHQERRRLLDRITVSEKRYADMLAAQRDIAENVRKSEERIGDIRSRRNREDQKAVRLQRAIHDANAAHIRDLKQLQDLQRNIEEAGIRRARTVRGVNGQFMSWQSARLQEVNWKRRRDAQQEQLKNLRQTLTKQKDLVKEVDAEAARETERLNQAVQDQTTYVKEADKAYKEWESTKLTVLKTDEQLVRHHEDVERAMRSHADALKSLGDASRESNVIGKRLRTLAAALPLVPRGFGAGGTAGFVGAFAVLLADLIGTATSAAQSLWLLPAAATAAGSAIGTLALGVQGFGDVMKELDDPEKFAEAIQKLAPNAQQAALTIRDLINGPIKELQQATQDALFFDVGRRLHELTNQFQPTIQTLTTGIAGAMNQMFGQVFNQLMTPEMQTSIQNIVNNLVLAFQQLAPAMGPLTEAFVRISEVGAGILPEVAQAAVHAANAFADFIRENQASGQLNAWLRDGLQTLQQLGEAAIIFGHAMFQLAPLADVFLPVIIDLLKMWDSLMPLITAQLIGLQAPLAVVTGNVDALKDAFLRVPGAVDLVNDVIANLPVVATKAVNGVIDALNGLKRGFAGIMNSPLGKLLSTVVPGMNIAGGAISSLIPDIPKLPDKNFIDVPNVGSLPGTNFAGNGLFAGSSPTGGVIDSRTGEPVTKDTPGAVPIPGTNQYYIPGQTSRSSIDRIHGTDGTMPSTPGPLPTAGLPPWAPQPVPPPPPTDASGGKLSDKERRDQIRASLNPDDFAVDPFAPFAPGGGPMPTLGGPPMMGPVVGGPMMGGDPRFDDTNLNPIAAQLNDIIGANFPITEIGGWRADGQGSSDHPSGSALDVMIPNWDTPQGKALGDQINQFLLANAGMLGIDSTIWRDQMMFATGESGGTVKGHQNHIHVRTVESPNAKVGPGQVPPLMYGTGGQPYAQPGYGYYDVDQGAVLRAQHRVQREAFDVQQARMDLAVLEKDALATEQERIEARQKVQEEEWQFQEAQLALWEAQQGKWKKVGSGGGGGGGRGGGLGEIGPGLDDDFGLGDGLAGLADNLIRFVATLGMAPILGALGAISNGGQGGHGLFGMMGSINLANGMSPLGLHPLNSVSAPFGPGGAPTGMPTMGPIQGFGPPNSPQAIANMIYQQAISRGYSPQEAIAIVAYAIGESNLDPTASGGPQGGAGAENEVVGLFQQKPAFAAGGGIHPSMRTDPVANTFAYLNQLEQNRSLPIEQALPATSKGGPLAKGGEQAWQPLLNQAAALLGFPTGAGAAPHLGPQAGLPGPPIGASSAVAGAPMMAGGSMPGMGMPMAAPFTGPMQATGRTPGQGGWQPSGGGFAGLGGLPMAAIQTGISAAGAATPGGPAASAAAETALQLINRTIAFGGQVGAIGVQGLMETFGLHDTVIGDPSQSWFGRLLAGFAGARPALPTSAGQTEAPVQQQQPMDPNQHMGTGGQPGPGGPTVNIESFVQAPNRDGQKVINDLAFDMYASRGGR